MYILALVVMVSCIGLEATKYVYNDTEKPIIVFSHYHRKGPGGNDVQSFKSKEIRSYGPRYGKSINIQVGSEYEAGGRDALYNQDSIKWSSKYGDRVLVVESDATDESGLKAHTVSKEEFDKMYKAKVGTLASDAPERKAPAVLPPG